MAIRLTFERSKDGGGEILVDEGHVLAESVDEIANAVGRKK